MEVIVVVGTSGVGGGRLKVKLAPLEARQRAESVTAQKWRARSSPAKSDMLEKGYG